MRRLALAAALAFAGSAAFAEDLGSIYQTAADDDGKFGMVQFAPCGGKICGTLIKSFEKGGKEYKSENIGRKIVWDMVQDGDGSYSGGKIWQPSSGKEYKSKMKVSAGKLKVSGCVGPICRSQTWTKVK